jgi:hypothetical protein
MRLLFLFPLVMLASLISTAWTPCAEGRRMSGLAWTRNRFLSILVIGFGLMALTTFVVDPWFSRHVPGYLPTGTRLIICSLPWVGVLQPLVLTAMVYAFAARLTHSAWAAIAAVVIARQGLLYLQMSELLPGSLPVVTVIVGVHALILACCYRDLGFKGLVAISLIVQLRHLAGVVC